MKHTEYEIKKAISIFPGFCNHWIEGFCNFPNSWKKYRQNRPKCRIQPGITKDICNLCNLDPVYENMDITSVYKNINDEEKKRDNCKEF